MHGHDELGSALREFINAAGGKMEAQTTAIEPLYEELVVACQERDKPTVMRCVTEIKRQLGLSATQLAAKIGVSDQSVGRWQRQKHPYEMAMPSEEVLAKLGDLIRNQDVEGIPEHLPAVYFKVVAMAQRPSTRYLRFFHDTCRSLGGIELSEETCLALLADLERGKSE